MYRMSESVTDKIKLHTLLTDYQYYFVLVSMGKDVKNLTFF